ncbi:FtsQ-type POTRA domain-containing protein [Cronbergia sp. UHCC 0137]|uniref:cell division protein FtsQ/DivIB n=1 Tax=Cronbergia sp. UHCC 0137 TaxID=3110239 RepID=UPI002B1EF5FD|nr:FtsQ-type POTRA domain-containing protein [Cronbergia sp. UHCC 0137]MEA5616407.1 FtsQ-type POTRA domain-containing protein [Cronbergia sp. UHCC 0137]
MAVIGSVSRTDLAQRRKKLRRQRQMKIFQAIWRTFVISGLAGGLFWVVIQPMWMLTTPTQVEIKSGKQLLSEQAIESLLVLTYPQSLWRVEPSAIAQSLKQQPIIAQATVNRRLFPPGLIIEIQERVPVAIAQISLCQPPQCPQNSPKKGLIDASGVWMPLEKYTSLHPKTKLPSLKMIGSPKQYRPFFPQLYELISQSSLKITVIDYQNPTNLILQTELGQVHLGVPSPQLPEQIKVLVQMRNLSTKLDISQIEYIDLKNPESPLVQMNRKNQPILPK